jgi:hypothetical protein
MSKHGMSSKLASQVKRGGHLREQIFSNQFSNESMLKINQNVNYSGSSADCFINDEDYLYIISQLNVASGNTSVKGGSTYQFHLGKIPELLDYSTIKVEKITSESNSEKLQTSFSSSISNEQQFKVLSSFEFWKKYLGKGEILALDVKNEWNFFAMRDVLNLMINPNWIQWRFLPTGRIKGDLIFKNNSKKAGITFEHRFEKNQSVIGAHGGTTGVDAFFPWLIEHIPNVIKVVKMTT